MPSLRDSYTIPSRQTTNFILIFTQIFLTFVVLVLNKMALVLVIESLVAIEHEHRRQTEHEHEFTNISVKNLETRADMWVMDENDTSSQYRKHAQLRFILEGWHR